MGLQLELQALSREIQRPLEQIAKLFPLGPEDFRLLPQARVYNTANISLTSGVVTTLTFDTERWDVGGLHSTSSNPGRLTVTTPGLYLVTGHTRIAAAANGTRALFIRLNGTTGLARVDVPGSGASTAYQSISTVYRLAATEYVELLAFQDSGGALNVVAEGNLSPEFSISWLSP